MKFAREKYYVFWTARQDSKGKRNNGPRTVGMQSKTAVFLA